MTFRRILPVLLAVAVVGCDETLTVEPSSEVPEATAITNRTSAYAALAGIYDNLQDGSYYGGDFIFFADLSSDNVEHSGTFNTFREAEQNALRADNVDIGAIWDAMYETVGRANDVIAKVPGITDPTLPDDEKNQIVGEAYLARALTFHNLTKLWGDVPTPTAPPTSLFDAADVTRTAVPAVYAQIKSDLDQAEQLISTDFQRRAGSLAAVHAIRARVLLYEGTLSPGSADWQAVEDEADAVIQMGFDLAPTFADLFTPEGTDTNEDIFRLEFTPQDFTLTGYYYLRRSMGGRQELRPTVDLCSSYTANDVRFDRTIGLLGSTCTSTRFGFKWIDAVGGEDIHIIRLAEVLLIKAEAHARQNELQFAVDEYNKVRVRAGLSPHVLGVDVTTQQDVLDEIWHQRRLELAYEGDRWPELVRLGLAISVMDLVGKEHQVLYPLPKDELDVAPNLTQNPGY